MQLASKGLGVGLSALNGARQAQTHVASGARSLHVPVPRNGTATAQPVSATPFSSSTKQAARGPISSTAGRVLQTTRTTLSRFLHHLTTPGFTHPVAVGRSFHTHLGAHAAVRSPTIHQRLSAPVRHALTAARGPIGPRSTIQVGLGLARNFSSTRPIFQNIVQNVPVAGRALCEMDLDIKRKMQLKANMKRSFHEKDVTKENKKLKSFEKQMQHKNVASSVLVDELEHFFPTPVSAAPGVSTVLLVPLAPTPTLRLPLSDCSAEPLLLPFSELGSLMSSHHTHSLRISSLFSRLDAGRVWEKDVQCSAHGDISGLCTVLRIEFRGWSEGMVKNVIGESGNGWCRLMENHEEEDVDMDDSMSVSELSFTNDDDSIIYGLGHSTASHTIDPAASFILPTLDFSSSFVANAAVAEPDFTSISRSPSFSLSDVSIGGSVELGQVSPFASSLSLSDMGSEVDDDDLFARADIRHESLPRNESRISSSGWVEDGSHFADGISERRTAEDSSAGSWMGFSSDFLARSGPREELF